MIAYMESNFALQWILRQEQFDAVDTILNLAERREVDLRIPAFALVESEWKLRRQDIKRSQLQEAVAEEMRQHRRSKYRENVARLLEQLQGDLRSVANEDTDLHTHLVNRCSMAARILSLTQPVLTQALVVQRDHGLQFKDAVVLASILSDLAAERSVDDKLLITTDRDFSNDEVREVLQAYNCRVKAGFVPGLAAIRAGRSA